MRSRNDFAQYGPEVYGVGVNPDVSAMYRWDVLDPNAAPGQPPGGMLAAGIGGPITGQGAHLAIIDDPIKDAEQANSKLQRDAIWDWYRFVLRTRMMPDGAIVLVLTRWHEDDLAGRLLKQAEDDPKADQWTVLRLPALAEEGDPLHRPEGEALWPGQYDEKALSAVKATVGSYVWTALYQQRPQPLEGGIFKRDWFRYFTEDGEFYILRKPNGTGVLEHRVKKSACWRLQTVDVAASTKTTADYFVISTWAITPDRDSLLVDVFRTRVEGPEQKVLLRTHYDRYLPAFQGIESVAYQLTLVQEAVREGLPARELKADRDKIARALPAGARYEAGTVYHRLGAPWLQIYEDELLQFPTGQNDDMVDTAGYMALSLPSIVDLSNYKPVGQARQTARQEW
jgi:predicted phage terminase large subunit-like protein